MLGNKLVGLSLIFRTYFWVKLEILVKENFSVFRIGFIFFIFLFL